MKIEETTQGDRTILKLQGRLTITDTDELRNKVNDLVREGRVRIRLDVADVAYMDSAGLGAITTCYTAASHANGELKLINIGKKVRDLLTVTRLIDTLEERG